MHDAVAKEPTAGRIDASDGPLEMGAKRGHMCADTFGVGIKLTEEEFQFVVGVPSDVDSSWTDPEEFQSLVAETVWERLDRQSVFESVDDRFQSGETATLGTVTLDPDGTVVSHDLSIPDPAGGTDKNSSDE